MNKKLNQLRKNYESNENPALDRRVKEALLKSAPKKHWRRPLFTAASSVAAAFVLFVAGLNVSPAFAQSAQQVPVLGAVAKVFTFRDYQFSDGGFEAHVRTPKVCGLGNDELEAALNKEFADYGQSLITQFEADMRDIQAKFPGEEVHMGILSDYAVKTDSRDVLSVEITTYSAAGSSFTQHKYYNIDKNTRQLITLPGLFTQGADYKAAISSEIIRQMKQQMASDENVMYWVEPDGMMTDVFTQIPDSQPFYINSNGQLVISFDKYAVAPGYMGTPEFIIPTRVLEGILAPGAPVK